MRKLLKLQLMQYRSPAVQVMFGLLVAATFLGWLSHSLFNAPAHIVLLAMRTILQVIFLGSVSAMQYIPHVTALFISWQEHTLPLHIPMPQLWSLLARLLASLPVGAAAAASYLVLAYAFRQEPYVVLPGGQQWLLYASYYLLGISGFVNMLAVHQLLKDRLALPRGLRFLSRLSNWRVTDNTTVNITVPVFYYVLIIGAAVFFFGRDNLPLSRPVMALIICAFSVVITYVNSYLLEKYGYY
ncbi:MAG: hypothetical protein KGZ45_08030 [Clostridium sp.]|nr:hypothetical protein [Clostridium sp.]